MPVYIAYQSKQGWNNLDVLMFMKEVSFAHLGGIYFTKNKNTKLGNIQKFYYDLK